jgi:tetrapyrrole methylase family protein/MazG family protein
MSCNTNPVPNDTDQLLRLRKIVEILRGPTGCPWDREQTHLSLLSNLTEESAEFIEAVHNVDIGAMREELGDVLLQIMLHSVIAQQSGQFTLEEVAAEICEKLIRRHPHVFGDTAADSSDQVMANWERLKAQEKSKASRNSALDGIPPGLPALQKAQKLQRKAAKAGFDWDDISPVLDKVSEEIAELRAELAAGNREAAGAELGDILFALVNVARHLKTDAEGALRATNAKFERRFRYVEECFSRTAEVMTEASLEQMDRYWDEAKAFERKHNAP